MSGNKIGIVLTLYDQATSKLKNIAYNLDGLRQKVEQFSRGALIDGAVVGAGLYKTVGAFSDLEDASTRLQVTMMDKNGLTGAFKEVNALAVKLGNELPGTAADFLSMMATLKQFGITDASILGGVGEATAKIAVLMKMAPDAAAEFAAKMKQATGTADEDMLGLMDTIQRVYHQGVSATEMMYAFARSGGALKNFGVQGLGMSKELTPIYAQLLKGGLSGETIGTGFAAILTNLADNKKLKEVNAYLAQFKVNLKFFDKQGKFVGPSQMVAELDKLRTLNPLQLNAVLKHLTGGGQDMQMLATIINEGMAGYQKMMDDMDRQAALQDRVNKQLGTLRNLWDAASGTFTNALAAFAETFSPELKALTELFGNLSEGIINFTKTHPELTRWIGLAAVAFVGLAIGLGVVGLAYAGVLKYISLVATLFSAFPPVALFVVNAFTKVAMAIRFVSLAIAANPIGALLSLLAFGAVWVITNWDKVKGWFNDFVTWMKEKVKLLADMMPDWMKGGPTINVPTAPPVNMAPSVPKAGDARKQDVGGTLNIKIDSDGRAKVSSMKPNNPSVRFNVDSGYTMASA